MDRTSIIVLVVCFALLMLWYPLVVNKLYPPKPLPPRLANAPAATTSTGTNVQPEAVPVPSLSSATNLPARTINTNVAEELLVVTNKDARYTFTTHGGGLKTVELLRYKETVSRNGSNQSAREALAFLNAPTAPPVLDFPGDPELQGDGVFTLTNTGNSVRAEKLLPNGLRVIRNFDLESNYLFSATVRLENTSAQPLALPQQPVDVGTAAPMGPQDNGQFVGVMWYDGSKGKDIGPSDFSTGFLGCIVPRTPPTEVRAGASNVVWVTAHNQFFALVAMPSGPAPEIVVRPLELPRFDPDEVPRNLKNAPPPKGYEATIVYPAVTLTGGQSIERRFQFFAGPKEYRTLASIASRFQNNVDTVMGFDRGLGGRFSGFFAKVLLLSMNGLHDLLKLGYGWVIIAITVIIKVLFWPLTQASTRSMKRMQALQPQMKALQEKYKDDPQKLSQKQLEFWKKNKVNPMGGCLPMLLQIPVFVGFYVMIQSAIELRGETFLWVKDLTRPDTLFIIPGLNFPFNLLPLVMGATMLWQSHLTPPTPGMDPVQQKMMRYMPLMFMLFLYNYSAGMTLYWTVQNLLTILQTKLTKTISTDTVPPPSPAPVLTAPQKKRK